MRPVVLTLAFALVFIYASSQHLTVKGDLSSVTFTIRNFGLQVEGSFSELKGSIYFNESNVSLSTFDLEVPASTIDTGIALRNAHLNKKEYFDVGQYPTLRFVSTKVERMNEIYQVTGKLTIKGQSRELSIPVKVSSVENDRKLSGVFTVNRRDYGVGSSSFSLADEVTVNFEILAGN